MMHYIARPLDIKTAPEREKYKIGDQSYFFFNEREINLAHRLKTNN